MKCKNCGFEHEQDFEYCVNCGAKAIEDIPTPVEAVSLNPAADVILPALRDKLFLALCILMTALCLLSLSSSGLPLLNILFTIFMWLAYADAQKGFVNEKHLQCISGTVYAQYVIINVASIIFIVCGLLFGGLFSLVSDNAEVIAELDLLFETFGLSQINITQEILDVFGWIFGAVFVIIGVIMLLINVFMMRTIHRFAKSVYMGIMFQNPEFVKPESVRNWFVFIAVCGGINVINSITLASPIAILESACLTAIPIIVIMLINKHIL